MNQNLLITVAGISMLGSACCGASDKGATRRPNVILIHADDLGKGMLSGYGQQQMTTPNIDRIINEGLRFNNAYSSAYSAPARASLLTGYNDCRFDKFSLNRGGPYCVTDTTLIAAQEKIVNNTAKRLAEGDLHMAQVFKAAGYNTFAVGKLEWGFLSTRQQMRERGWDHYYGYLDHRRCHGFYPPFLFEDGQMVMIDGNTHADAGATENNISPTAGITRWDFEGKVQYCEDLFIEKVLQYVRQSKDEPFFLYYPSIQPHGPISIPAIHPELGANKNLTPAEKAYGSMVKDLDKNVGRLLDELVRLGIDDNTMIIFTADNGHALYYGDDVRSSMKVSPVTGEAFDDYENKFNSTTGGDVFNGNASTSSLKRSNLDGGTCVPFAVRWAGTIAAGQSNELIANYDLLATMADMLGVEMKYKKSGASYLGVLLDGEKLPKEKYILTDSQNGGPMIVNNEGWKLRYYYPAKCFELFDLEADPMEQQDRIKERPDIAEDLRAKLETELEAGYIYPRFYVRNESVTKEVAERDDKVKSLQAKSKNNKKKK